MLLGLTGGMGSGKSSALKLFSELGCKTLDADSICHKLYSDKNSEIFGAMHKRWGDKILSNTGEIDRNSVGKMVFPIRMSVNGLIYCSTLQSSIKA